MRLHPITKSGDPTMESVLRQKVRYPKRNGRKSCLAGLKGGYGKTVIVEHENGRESVYAHCDQIYVQPGDVLKAGEKIAEVGSTGVSTGNHLHFEMRENGQAIDPLAHFPWLFE